MDATYYFNRIDIITTKFVDFRSGIESYGVRVYDDNAQGYDNTWDSIPAEDLDVLKELIRWPCNSSIEDILLSMKENQTGVSIDNTRYEWADIQHLFEKSS